ncbi:MAG: hypothetical protein AB7S87_08250 [Burkholderiales bacterium]
MLSKPVRDLVRQWRFAEALARARATGEASAEQMAMLEKLAGAFGNADGAHGKSDVDIGEAVAILLEDHDGGPRP